MVIFTVLFAFQLIKCSREMLTDTAGKIHVLVIPKVITIFDILDRNKNIKIISFII